MEQPMVFQDVDVFTDFVMLVVPKVGQESARWKYDARKDEQTLTVYRLSYQARAAAVSDCLSLQFSCEPSNPFAYSLYPTFTSGGIKTEPDFIQDLLRKSVLTSAADIQTLLDRLDNDFQDNNLAAQVDEYEAEQASGYPEFSEREGSVESIGGSSEDDEGDESGRVSDVASDVASELSAEVQLDDGQSSLLRRSKRISGIEAEKLVKRVKQKRSRREPAPAAKKPKISAASKNDKRPKQLQHTEVEECIPSPVFDDLPSLPVHPSSGGTIFSSQYWTEPAEDRTRLNCEKEIFVDKGTLNSLPDLTKVPEDKHYAESVKYGWLLVEHLLGGSEAISRSFAYVSSGTCPIEKRELMDVVVQVREGVLGHPEGNYGLIEAETNAQYKDLGTFKLGNSYFRVTSDVFLKPQLKKNSYPDPRKVQIARGFDFYIDADKLKEIEQRCKTGNSPLHMKFSRFATEAITELIGGRSVYLEGLKRVYRGASTLIGDDIFEAMFIRTQKVFDLDDGISFKTFRRLILHYIREIEKCNLVTKENTGVMASLLFQPVASCSLQETGSEDPPAKPGCNYWTTRAPHRTRLSRNSSFYMDTLRLAEYQRYLGPESSKRLRVAWVDYLKAVIQYAAGGEERFLRSLVESRKTESEVTDLDSALMEAIYGDQQAEHAGSFLKWRTLSVLLAGNVHHSREQSYHVEHLFNTPHVTRMKIMATVKVFHKRQLEVYDTGATRWYFPDLDERPKPDRIVLLDELEYWRKPGPDRTQVRPHHDVYIRTKVLESIASYFGPQSKVNCIKQYSYALLVHMLGGPDSAEKLWRDVNVTEGIRALLLFDDVVAVCLHCDEVFHLAVSINPTASFSYVSVRLAKRGDHQSRKEKRLEKGARTRQPKNLLHFALNVE